MKVGAKVRAASPPPAALGHAPRPGGKRTAAAARAKNLAVLRPSRLMLLSPTLEALLAGQLHFPARLRFPHGHTGQED